MSNSNEIANEETNFQNKASNEGKLFQDKIKGLFLEYNLEVKVLDKYKSEKRPDFLIFLKNNKKSGFICECKFKASAGTFNNGEAHISILSRKLLDATGEKAFQYNNDSIKKEISEKFEQALSQYHSLIQSEPFYKNFPFVIAFGCDFFVDNFSDKDKVVFEQEIPEISALIQIEENKELREILKGQSTKDLENLINNRDKLVKLVKKISPPFKRFKVLLNPNAKNRFKPNKFFKNPIVVYPKTVQNKQYQ